jgi:hypothetical protein
LKNQDGRLVDDGERLVPGEVPHERAAFVTPGLAAQFAAGMLANEPSARFSVSQPWPTRELKGFSR